MATDPICAAPAGTIFPAGGKQVGLLELSLSSLTVVMGARPFSSIRFGGPPHIEARQIPSAPPRLSRLNPTL